MSDTIYGNKYAATKDMNRAQLAGLIRADIKAAVAAGELPKAKYSVRKRDFAGGGAIDVMVTHVEEPGFQLFNEERLAADLDDPHTFTRLPVHSERAREILAKLDKITAAYNYDGSDIQSDYFHVRFYGHAKFGWEWERDVRAVEIEALKTKRAAAEAVFSPVRFEVVERAPSAQESYLAHLGVEG